MWRRWSFAVFSLLLASAITYALMHPSVHQPAPYNHKKHIDLNMPCAACHNGALTGVHATLPKTQICMNCHAQSTKEIFKPIQAFAQNGGEIPWARVTKLPDYAYFSHRRHTTLGQLKCQACHGPIQDQTRALTRPLLPVTMARCIACHRKTGAATDCDACHR